MNNFQKFLSVLEAVYGYGDQQLFLLPCSMTGLKLGKLQCISNFNTNENFTESSLLRRFKEANRDFRGIKVALMNIFCIHS